MAIANITNNILTDSGIATSSFVPYEDLTQAIVEGWLNAGCDVAAIDAELTEQLDNIKNHKTEVLPNPF